MSNRISVPVPENFHFHRAVAGHGWYDLAPFRYDEAGGTLYYTYFSQASGQAESIKIYEKGGGLTLVCSAKDRNEAKLIARHILRLDEDLEDFYRTVGSHDLFRWVEEMNAGRLLRSGTVFEDLVKTLCTTNCSWSLTRSMTGKLVDRLGGQAADGSKAFPTAEAMASRPAQFYREEIKAGYRSPYFVELATAVAGGELDPESWLHSELSTDDLRKEMKKIKGIGDYAADNLLKLLGRYDGLALDSWLRAGFYKKHNREKPCPDKKIERHYKKFGRWQGLAMWCDMTKSWFEEGR